MPSESNKRVLERFTEFINTASAELADQLIAPDASFHVPGRRGASLIPDVPQRRQPNDLTINGSVLPLLTTRTAHLGLGFGDRFGGFQGRSGSFKERMQHTEKPGELQAKRTTKRLLGIT